MIINGIQQRQEGSQGEHRLTTLRGDLSKPSFGLDPPTFQSLFDEVGVILQCAADVNFILSAQQLAKDNVFGTREVRRSTTNFLVTMVYRRKHSVFIIKRHAWSSYYVQVWFGTVWFEWDDLLYIRYYDTSLDIWSPINLSPSLMDWFQNWILLFLMLQATIDRKDY